MVEQFSVYQAQKGKKVAFISVEAPANFVAASLKLRASAMGYRFEDFENNIILMMLLLRIGLEKIYLIY
jgi:hypothetical protein